MQSVQRHFGKYMKRSADEQQISVLLKDFEDADQLLARIIDASKAWRESWMSILTYQHRLFAEFDGLYAPIVGAGEDYKGHQPVDTPEKIVARTARITTEYEELKKDLMEEISQVDVKMIKPAQESKDSLHLLKKTIRKREDKKLDFERYQGRVDSGLKKTKRSDRESAALSKAQSDLAQATEAYEAADDHLRSFLPRLLTVVFSLLPHLLAAQIQIQNSLLAHYYTMLHTFCTEEGFPSPSPPMDEVIRLWDDTFKPIQQEAESINILANGKTVKTSMNFEDNHNSNGFRRPSNHSFARVASVSPARALPPSPNYEIKPKISSSPSPSSTFLLSPLATPATTESASSSVYQTPISYTPTNASTDYFTRDRHPSTASQHSTSISNTAVAAVAQKKKPPPPPPPPRIPSHHQNTIFVTALYDFSGQGEGDLAFKEGDRIRVVKKTESTDDWWVGELRGVKGPFPANYVQ